MLATAWRAPFSDPGWLFEPKWDGYRLIVVHDGEVTQLRTRNGNDVTRAFPELVGVGLPNSSFVVDGEVVVFDDSGRPSFERLQQHQPGSGGAACFVAFDLLHADCGSLVGRPIEERLEMLSSLQLPATWQRSEVVDGAGTDLWDAIVASDLEGMVAKRKGSRYLPGVRSDDWRKIHHINTTKVVVGGFTRGEGARTQTLGSLLVGLWDGDRLRWAGAVGTGFSDGDLLEIRAALDLQIRADSPFHPDPGLPHDVTWVEPALVAIVGYRNWTEAGRLRQPRFKGFSADRVDDVTWLADGPHLGS
jgi:bifunctional non-homologous end joining protein LigD